jgi:putative endonuclease
MPLPLFWFRLLPFWRRAEIRAARYLRSQGYRIVATNFRVKEGEIDLVAWDAGILVFVEVKSRTSTDLPESAVGIRKRTRVIRAAHAYIARFGLQRAPYRFDILAVNETPMRNPEFRLIRDAFHTSPSGRGRREAPGEG